MYIFLNKMCERVLWNTSNVPVYEDRQIVLETEV